MFNEKIKGEKALQDKLVSYFFGGRHPEYSGNTEAMVGALPSHVTREISRADTWSTFCRIHGVVESALITGETQVGDGVRSINFNLVMKDGTEMDTFTLVVAQLADGVYSIYPDQMTFENLISVEA